MTDTTDRATLAGGCFWCVEAVFERVRGVTSVTSGYAGGTTEDPTYEEVCTGETGHAEVVQIEYDPEEITYEELLDVFFVVHDPTTLNRQGPDVGTQYRSAIFYHDEAQRETAEAKIAELESAGAYDDPIVTEVEPLEAFYEAEEYHQDFFEKVEAGEQTSGRAYCQMHIPPKIDKLRETFSSKVASEPQTTDD